MCIAISVTPLDEGTFRAFFEMRAAPGSRTGFERLEGAKSVDGKGSVATTVDQLGHRSGHAMPG
jgi:hypothetical protein